MNNASSPEGATLLYEFQLFADAGLTSSVPGEVGVPEGEGRTCFTVRVNLGEDTSYHWRARAGDGFSSSAWAGPAAFTVDAVNQPPSAPVPDSPRPGARVASREPVLSVLNASDPDYDVVTYELRVATDPEMAEVVTSATGVSEGPGITEWTVPVSLQENAIYYWSARASDGEDASPWTRPIWFMVDTMNESPSAPVLLSPEADAEVATQTPELRVGPASDPEGDAVTYRIEVDVVPSFDSASRQASPVLPDSGDGAGWVPEPLADNTLHHWRAVANDGTSDGPWATASFFVNLANDAPGPPVPLHPADGQVVTTATPTLTVRNAVDPDRDLLTYEFVVTDETGAAAASTSGVPEGDVDTDWTVPVELSEDRVFEWASRASDGEAEGPWSAPASFRVNAVPDPPTAPGLIAPPEGAVLDVPRPELIVSNATSPEGLTLTYTFELYLVLEDGGLELLEAASGVPEGEDGQTLWVPSQDLLDGAYSFRARAVDANQPGPWMESAHFGVALDAPPAPPEGLVARPGDAQVELSWDRHPEPDVAAYRVYRGDASGGPYARVADVTEPEYLDPGLMNGVTVYYVVTALDARHESGYSSEVAATPQGASVVQAEIRLSPDAVDAECLRGHGNNSRCGCGPSGEPSCGNCPTWIYVTIELPGGYDPRDIDRGSVRLAGSVGPDRKYDKIVDSDRDGIPERKLRFAFDRLAPLLAIGRNLLRVTGRVGTQELEGAACLTVRGLKPWLHVLPRVLWPRNARHDLVAWLTFERPFQAKDVDTGSVRLNETVPVKRVIWRFKKHLVVSFDRQEVDAVLPEGRRVEVRVAGRVDGVDFVGVDHVRVVK